LSQIGIYCFAAAVFLSLITSFALNIVDASWRRSNLKQMQHRNQLEDVMHDTDKTAEAQDSFAFLLADREEHRVFPSCCRTLLSVFITVGAVVLYFMGVSQSVAWREVKGVYPTVLDPLLYNDTDLDQDNPLNKWYSLWEVLMLIGSGGGADTFLSFIWLLFVIIGPGLLVVSMLITTLVPMKPNMQYWALLVTQLLTSFAAWEVVCAAFLIMTLEYPALSDWACGPSGKGQTPVRDISNDLHYGGVPGACVYIQFLELAWWAVLPLGFAFMFFGSIWIIHDGRAHVNRFTTYYAGRRATDSQYQQKLLE